MRRAKHRKTKQHVAVKVLKKYVFKLLLKSVSRKNLTHYDVHSLNSELEVMQVINHPNIVNMQDMYQDEKRVCLVYELMEGGEVSIKTTRLTLF